MQAFRQTNPPAPLPSGNVSLESLLMVYMSLLLVTSSLKLSKKKQPGCSMLILLRHGRKRSKGSRKESCRTVHFWLPKLLQGLDLSKPAVWDLSNVAVVSSKPLWAAPAIRALHAAWLLAGVLPPLGLLHIAALWQPELTGQTLLALWNYGVLNHAKRLWCSYRCQSRRVPSDPKACRWNSVREEDCRELSRSVAVLVC